MSDKVGIKMKKKRITFESLLLSHFFCLVFFLLSICNG